MFKRISFSLLILALIFSSFSFSQAFAESNNNDVTILGNTEYTVVKDESGNNMTQIKDLETGEIEFVKTEIKDGVYINSVISSEGEVLNTVEYFEETDTLLIDGKLAGGKTLNPCRVPLS